MSGKGLNGVNGSTPVAAANMMRATSVDFYARHKQGELPRI
jgi:hypothetical protein